MNFILKKKLEISFLLVLFFFMSGCGDNFIITTRALADGSIERIIEYRSETEVNKEKIFPLPAYSTWTVSQKWEKKDKSMTNKNGKIWIYTARKKFAPADEIKLQYTFKENITIHPVIRYEKKFAGIFTHFTFKETYPVIPLFKRLPAIHFFSPTEMKWIKASLKNDKEIMENVPDVKGEEMEKKLDNWLIQSLFEELMAVMVAEAKKMNNPDLTANMMLTQKDKLYSLFFEKREDIFEISISEYLAKYSGLVGNPAFKNLWLHGQKAFIRYEKTLASIRDCAFDSIDNEVVMPGIITGTNAPAITGNACIWKETPVLYLIFNDLEMRVESRQVNLWFITIVGIILLIVIIFLVTGRLGKKTRVKNNQ